MDPADARRRVRDSTLAGWQVHRRWDPKLIVRADGSRFWDADGREYLDFGSQLVATNLGFGNGAVTSAIAAQASALPFVNPGFATNVRAELAEALDGVLPDGLRRYFFSTSGTEANEAALKLARLATGRSHVLARRRSYHGSTAASISVSGDLRRPPVEGLDTVPGRVEIPDCYCYRCPLGLQYPSCGVACADEVDSAIRADGDVAAVIVEPIVGTNGVLVPVPEYLPRVREITERHGVLLIADEVMTGWGRTGAWFAVDHWKVRPDLLTTAKGITGGYVPLGLTAMTPELAARFEDRMLPHGHTYEGHPVALAAAHAAIREYQRLGLVERSRVEGAYLLDAVRRLAAGHPSVGEVRGLGLFAAVELVRDRTTREPLSTAEEKQAGKRTVADAVAAAMMADGVFVLPWVSHVILAPPLIIERSETDRALAALDRALAVSDRAVDEARRARTFKS